METINNPERESVSYRGEKPKKDQAKIIKQPAVIGSDIK